MFTIGNARIERLDSIPRSIIANGAAAAAASAAAAWATVRHGLGETIAGDVHPDHGHGTFVHENRARPNRSGADRVRGETRIEYGSQDNVIRCSVVFIPRQPEAS